MNDAMSLTLLRLLLISVSTVLLIVTKIATPVEAYLLAIMFWIIQISYDIQNDKGTTNVSDTD